MKLYVLVRKDMTPEYQSVQAGHAIAEYLIEHPSTEWKNGTLVYLGVKSEHRLKQWIEKLEQNEIKFSFFREPDIGNEITALASYAPQELFRNLNLLKF